MTATLEKEAQAAQAGLQTGCLVVDRAGGGTRSEYVALFCSELARSGTPVEAVVSQTSEPEPAANGYPRKRWLRETRGQGFVRRAIVEIFNLAAMAWAIRSSRSNVVIMQAGDPRRLDPLVVRILHIFHKRVVWCAHEVVRPHMAVRAVPRVFRKLYRRADAVIVFSRASARRIVEASPKLAERLWLIPYGDVSRMTDTTPDPVEVRKQLGITGRAPVVVSYSEVASDRGVLDFVEAVADLRESDVHVEAVIGGSVSGPVLGDLKRLVQQRALGDRVFVRTFDVWRGTRDELFEAADVVVVPYRGVGESLVPLLALAHARPVVTTDLGGLGEVVTSESKGAVAPAGNSVALADALYGVVHPRRRLQQAQWELLSQPTADLSWPQIIADFEPALALGSTSDGRSLATSEKRKAVVWVWGLVMTFTIVGAIAALAEGLSLENPLALAPVIVIGAVVYLIAVPIEQKVINYVFAIIFVELGNRLLQGLPLQLITPLFLIAAVAHLIIQPPSHPVRLKGTRPLHVIILLLAGWMIAEVFNPNMRDIVPGLRSIRLLLEPMMLYALLISYFGNEKMVKRLVNAFLVIGFLACMWGIKITFVGYFGFEEAYIQETGQGGVLSESRNIGTMVNPQTWGMFNTALVIVSLSLILHGKEAFRHRWLLVAMIPAAALNAISSGQRIQFIALAVAIPLLLALTLASRATRTRAIVAVVIAIFVGVTVWYWIPEDGGSRKGLQKASPIDAARSKLAALKNQDQGATSVDERYTNATPTIIAVTKNPLGGGTGLTFVSKLVSGLNPASSVTGSESSFLGGASDNETRSRNIVPVRGGDYFYVDFASEQGIPGVILVVMLFIVGTGWCLFAFMRMQSPFNRAIAAGGFVWMIALMVNNVTNGAFFSPQTSSVFFIFLAVVVVTYALENRDEESVDHEAARTAELDAYT